MGVDRARRGVRQGLIVCAQWAAEHGLDDASPAVLATSRGVREEVRRAAEEANSHLTRAEQIKRLTILPTDWLPGGDALTPTMKLKSKTIAEKYAGQIDEPYASPRHFSAVSRSVQLRREGSWCLEPMRCRVPAPLNRPSATAVASRQISSGRSGLTCGQGHPRSRRSSA